MSGWYQPWSNWLSPLISGGAGGSDTVLTTARTHLRLPRMADAEDWIALRRQSRTFIEPWEPAWPEDDLTQSGFFRRCQNARRDRDLETGWSFLIRDRSGGQLLGSISLTGIRRGAIQAGNLGYWTGQPYMRQGYMSEAVTAVCEFGFSALHLHRIHATCAVNNDASRLLLLKAGFKQEGRALAYLKINHIWTDHDLFGRISPLYMADTSCVGTDLKDTL